MTAGRAGPWTDRARSGAKPGLTAYIALLSVTSLGTISSTIMSAPINEIASTIGASDRGIVLAVAAFTVAMVLTAPAAGWLADRFGSRAYLFASLVLMVVGQAMAGLSDNLTLLVVARTVQGLACSGIPVCVQHLLASHWPHHRRRSMAAWASAIGVGQAIGPLTGGAIAQAFGWRWVFGATAIIALAVLGVLVHSLPEAVVDPRATSLDLRALGSLTLGAGLLAIGLTGIGQGLFVPSATLTVLATVVLAAVLRPGRRPSVLGPLGRTPTFTVATLSAGTAMAVMGVTMVSVPVYLGSEFGLSPGVIGASTTALAFGMISFAPVAGRMAERLGTRRTLGAGLMVLILVTIALGLVEGSGEDVLVLPTLIALLFGVGCGIATVQSMAAALLLDVAGGSAAAMGVHNVGRFSGLCAGYAWLALALPLGQPIIVHIGSAALAFLSLLTLVLAARRGSPVPTSS